MPRASSRHRIMDYPWWQSSGIQIIMLNAMSPVILFLWLLFYTSDLLSTYCNMAIYGIQCYFYLLLVNARKISVECGWKLIYFQQERYEVIILSLRKYWLTSLKLCKAVKLKLTGRGNCSPPPPTWEHVRDKIRGFFLDHYVLDK